jgi:hypothetical protein
MYPERAQALREEQVNVFAMEEVRVDQFQPLKSDIWGRLGALRTFEKILADIPAKDLHVVFVGYSPLIDGAIRFMGLRDVASITVVPEHSISRCLCDFGDPAVIFTDSSKGSISCTGKYLSRIIDLARFDFSGQDENLPDYIFPGGRVPELGGRRIESLHETGRAGARFGLESVAAESGSKSSEPVVTVIGYGNVAMGAVSCIVDRGLSVTVLNRYHTANGLLPIELSRANLVINGALTPSDEFVITADHVSQLMKRGTVLVDLIGGSPTDRSPVEVVDTCTFLGRPSFDIDGVLVSSVFGWPNYYDPLGTSQRYSRQIAAVITESRAFSSPLELLPVGIRGAAVLGPFEKA